MPVKNLKRRSSVGAGGGSSKRIKLIRPQIAAANVGNVVLTLGMNDTGQLGLNTDISQRKKPSLVDTINEDIRIICAGGMHTLCVTAGGRLMSFGCNDEGALGRQTSDDDDEWTPNYVDLEGMVVQVTAGDSHSAALLDDGRVFAWGSFRDSSGSMGLTINGIQRSPLEILPGQNIIKIASGTDHLAMLNEDGQLFTCGCGEQGQLGRVSERASGRDCRQGLGHFLLPSLVPFKPRGRIVEDVWASYAATFVKCNDEILVFGLNNYSQLGFADNRNRFFPVPSPTFAGKSWQQLVGGQHHTLARDRDGRVYSLGRYEYGRLGLGENSGDATVLTIVPTLSDKNCVDIACGSVVSLAVSDDGLAYGWGMGSNAQLGNDESDIFIPTIISGNQLETRRSLRVAAGGQHTVLLATPIVK